ncbi:transposable element Tcb2 transposase [Trichonephila clavipes]|nr:transposable element Tcb2 transposase [Trichonephila clavipes]
MGYAQRTKGYRIWLIDENKLVETINVRFDENKRGINSNLRYNLNLPDYYDDEDDFDRVKDSLTSRLVSKTSTETPSTSEKPDVSSDNHSLIPCTEVKWIRVKGEATRLKSFNEIERYCKRHNIEYDPSLFNFRKDNTESQRFSDLSEQQEALMVEVTIPNCYKQAIRSRDASKWHDAMDNEINKNFDLKIMGKTKKLLGIEFEEIATLGSYQSEDSVSEDLFRPTTRATTPAEDRFLALSAREEEPLLCRSSLQTTFKHQEEESPLLRCEIVFTMQVCMQEDQLCAFLSTDDSEGTAYAGQETQQQWASVLFTDESRFTMESDSGRLLIWREQRTRYHQSNAVERHSYRGGGILVWAGISLGGHTDLHVFHGGTVTGLRYRDEILDPYVRPYAAAIGNDFILMDDNARPHRARIVEEYLEDHGLERMEWPARSQT